MKRVLLFSCLILLIAVPSFALRVRVKDIAKVQGVAENQLIGYGLVVGLEGTGDTKNTYSTIQTVANMLRNFGVVISSPTLINKIKNVAAVMVTASLSPFARSGDRVDAVVSSLGDATSLEGGTLLLTPLRAADNQVYATVQGAVSIGGFNITAGGGAKLRKNHPLVGRIPEGTLIARDMDTPLSEGGLLSLMLNHPDFNTALRLSAVINKKFADDIAKAEDAARITVKIPNNYKDSIVSLIAQIEGLSITPDTVAKVIVNERTGTVVMGGKVKISPIAISHGNLSITISKKEEVSQPAPLAPGATVVTTKAKIKAEEEGARLMVIPEGNSIEDVVRSLNAVGVTPRDMIAILQAIKEAGALPAELEIM